MNLTPTSNGEYRSDPYARGFIILAIGYLLTGVVFGVVGAMQYAIPGFLKHDLSFSKTRPLHVYLVISWIFTAAQGMIYYFIPRIGKRPLYWPTGMKIQLWMQIVLSLVVIVCFLNGRFGGREYLEFPPWMGGLILLSWLPFLINFFATLRPDYRTAPVYIWSWTTGIIFFFITVSESYLWIFDHFNNNIIRDITVQWKALGSMVGSWNMLVYGIAMYTMERVKNDLKIARSPLAFAFYFLGLTNLLFNWGHHTYIIPAAPWVKTISYIVSMTELLLLGQLIWMMRKNLDTARKHYHIIAFRFLSYADAWILLNLTLAITISVPALNLYTHGTLITVAHAMGATIGINTLLLFGGIYLIIRESKPAFSDVRANLTGIGILITNISLLGFFLSLVSAGLVTIIGKMNGGGFAAIKESCLPIYRTLAVFGFSLLIGIVLISLTAIGLLARKKNTKHLLN